ncbi:E3 ubiquitin-protein ligase RNF128 [Galdieria sulphuraria]|uniref:RING-type E3 ubiquitin transferase n=1 Tax=Galdieria sulphuraria TaxID=130081 RepID=M2XR81_GALSU|nr:E3 ubiquitin-protein ligase RNF128 [Galdieria sulphuraria]EME32757.1 E3 ubiquitin-protein ligase RNF128 [Galdieria sulphuraria]|eukprot:XP_005709277.1 E3 ubiquitin-protein ligase RNF128 [Galdieria sulphuraria]
MFRRASSLCEQQRKKIVADVLLCDVCPLHIYEGYVVDGTAANSDQNEQFHIEGTVDDSVKSPGQVWQNLSPSGVNNADSYRAMDAFSSSKSKFRGKEGCEPLLNLRKEFAEDEAESRKVVQVQNGCDAEMNTGCRDSTSSNSQRHLLSNSFVDSEECEEQFTCLSTDECSICLESIRVGDYMRKLPCGHIFHATCVERWLLHAHRCPLCNKDLISCLNRKVSMEDNSWLNIWAQSERRRRPGWNRPFAHIRYLFQEHPFEWNHLQLLFENNENVSEIPEDTV